MERYYDRHVRYYSHLERRSDNLVLILQNDDIILWKTRSIAKRIWSIGLEKVKMWALLRHTGAILVPFVEQKRKFSMLYYKIRT
jgi:hypothetical protein